MFQGISMTNIKHEKLILVAQQSACEMLFQMEN